MKRILLATMLMLFCASMAQAQTAPPQDDDDYPKVEGYVGFSHLRLTGGGSVGLNGFNTSVVGNVSRYVGLKFDVSGNYKSESGAGLSIYNFTGGVQFKNNARAARLKPFAHLLAGGARIKESLGGFGDFSSTGFSAIAGAGLDIRAGRRVDVRVIQVDYNLMRFGGGSNHNVRIGAGLVFH